MVVCVCGESEFLENQRKSSRDYDARNKYQQYEQQSGSHKEIDQVRERAYAGGGRALYVS